MGGVVGGKEGGRDSEWGGLPQLYNEGQSVTYTNLLLVLLRG